MAEYTPEEVKRIEAHAAAKALREAAKDPSMRMRGNSGVKVTALLDRAAAHQEVADGWTR